MKKIYKILIYLAIFSFIPIIITIVELINGNNPELRAVLKLNSQNFLWWQVITYPFVHTDFTHYTNNLLTYLLAVIIGAILAIISNKIRFYVSFYIVSILIFTLLDAIIITYIYPLFGWTGPVCGLSGIDAVLLGFIPILWLISLIQYNKQLEKSWVFHQPYVILLIIIVILQFLGLYSYIGLISVEAAVIPLTLLIFGFFALLFFERNYFKELWVAIKNISRKSLVLLFVLFLFFTFFLLGIFMFFPTELINQSGRTDIITHYLGLLFGLLFGFAFMHLGRSLQ